MPTMMIDKRQRRPCYDFINSFLQIINDPVSQNKTDGVLLVTLTHLLLLLVSEPINQTQDTAKLRISMQPDLLDGIIVARHHPFDPVSLRSINVAVQCKAVADFIVG